MIDRPARSFHSSVGSFWNSSCQMNALCTCAHKGARAFNAIGSRAARLCSDSRRDPNRDVNRLYPFDVDRIHAFNLNLGWFRLNAIRSSVRLFVLAITLSACVAPAGHHVPARPDVAQPDAARPDAPLPGLGTADGDLEFTLSRKGSDPTNQAASPTIDPSRTYTLSDLIDLAQRNNPSTAAAWQRSRDAALAVGEVEATYLPQLSANVLAGFEHTSQFAPAIPELDIPDGRLSATGAQLAPHIAIEWLLFDFGVREAARQVAVESSIAANEAFYGAHQDVIFDVAEAYFRLAASRVEVRIDRERIADAKTLRAVAEGRLAEGLATTVEVAQARQLQMQAELDLTTAEGLERSAYARLMRSIGLSPSTKLNVADIADRQLPREIPEEIDRVIETALTRRADIRAGLALVRAGDAGVELAEAERRPSIAATGQVGHITAGYRLRDSRLSRSATLHDSRPAALVGVMVTIPLFDGGLRAHQEARARATAMAAERDLESLRLTAALEIVEAYNLLHTSLAAYGASESLVNTAETTYEASLGLYKNGLATLAEVSETKKALSDARLAKAEAFSDAFSGATALAFATGKLTNHEALDDL